MCTALFLPGSPGHLLLAANRDEQRTRSPALPPPPFAPTPGSQRLATAPIDADAGGTWIGANDAGLAMTLLNNYQRSAIFDVDTEGRPRSRGLIIPHLLGASSLQEAHDLFMVLHEAHASHTFPFTLAIADASTGAALLLGWSGRHLEVTRPPLPLLLISSGRDLEEVTPARTEALRDLLDVKAWDTHPTLGHHPEHITTRFAHGSPDPHSHSIRMARDDAHTVSHTRIIISPGEVALTYLDSAPGDPLARQHTRSVRRAENHAASQA